MELIAGITTILFFAAAAALFLATKRTSLATARARKAETDIESLREDLAEVRKAASTARRELDDARRELKSAQEDLKQTKQKAFKAQKKAEKAPSNLDLSETSKQWEAALNRSKEDLETAVTEGAKWRRKAMELQERLSSLQKPADGEAVKALQDSPVPDEPKQIVQEDDRRKAELDRKVARLCEELDRVKAESGSLRKRLRDKDNEILSARKRCVAAERSFHLIEREADLINARLAFLEGNPLDFEVDPIGDPLGSPNAHHAARDNGRNRTDRRRRGRQPKPEGDESKQVSVDGEESASAGDSASNQEPAATSPETAETEAIGDEQQPA